MYIIEPQSIILSDFECSGYVLDIGGGGEGVIGRLKGAKVIAIDPLKEELQEAPPGPLKIVMDAREMKFLDGGFSVVTCFFTLMYLKTGDHEQVLREIHRVLEPGGSLMLWDVNIPERKHEAKDIFVVPLAIQLPKENIKTSYGIGWTGREQDASYYVQLAEKVGFEKSAQEQIGDVFYLRLHKV